MGPAAVRYAMKPDGEPDAGNRHVRFDERGWKTEQLAQPQATASILDSTRSIRATGATSFRLYHQFERKREQGGSQKDARHGEEACLERTGIVLQPPHQIRSGEAPDSADGIDEREPRGGTDAAQEARRDRP